MLKLTHVDNMYFPSRQSERQEGDSIRLAYRQYSFDNRDKMVIKVHYHESLAGIPGFNPLASIHIRDGDYGEFLNWPEDQTPTEDDIAELVNAYIKCAYNKN